VKSCKNERSGERSGTENTALSREYFGFLPSFAKVNPEFSFHKVFSVTP
jgi:hypothetical protein